MDEDRGDGPGGAAGKTKDSHPEHRWVTTTHYNIAYACFLKCVQYESNYSGSIHSLNTNCLVKKGESKMFMKTNSKLHHNGNVLQSIVSAWKHSSFNSCTVHVVSALSYAAVWPVSCVFVTRSAHTAYHACIWKCDTDPYYLIL